MNCNFAEKVSALIDGELPSDEVLSIERHLFACDECQQLRVDFMSLRSELSNYPLPPLQPMQPRLAQRLSTPSIAPQSSLLAGLAAAFRVNQRKTMYGAVAAVLLIVMGLAVWISLQSRQRKLADASVAQDQRKQDSSTQPAPTPAASPEPSPKRDGKEEEAPSSPPKFRLREAITEQKPRREKVPEISPQPRPEIADTTAAIATNLTSTGSNAADAQTLTARHVEQSELLLRSFRNLRPQSSGVEEIGHERRRAEKLFYQNVMLRREADSSGDIEVASLLQSLEPILLDIANLPRDARNSEVRAIKDIKDRVERQNLVALLQINSRTQLRTNE